MRPLVLSLLALASAASAPAAPFAKGGVLGVGAWESGQAGAVVARSDDAQSLWWNPAGLDLDVDYDLALSYGDGLEGGLYDTSASHRGFVPGLDLAYGVGGRHVGSVPNLDQYEYGLGLAFPFTDDGRLLAGLTLRGLQATVGQVSASGYGVDLGLHWHPAFASGRMSMGLATRDLQADLNWPSVPPDGPQQLFQAGAAWAFDADSSVEFDGEVGVVPGISAGMSSGFKLGAERWWNLPSFGQRHVMAVRIGYLQDSSQQPSSLGGQFTAGLGLAWEGWHADYSWGQDPGSLGSLQRVSLSYAFAAAPGWSKAVSAPKPTPVPAARPLGLTVTASPQRFEPSATPKGLLIWVQAGGLENAARSRVDIVGPQGEGVAFREVSGVAQSFTWDGRKPGVGPAGPGDYFVTMLVWDAAGNTLARAQATFQLVAGPGPLILQPQAESFAPLAQSSRPQARADVSWGGIDPVRWTLSVAKEGAPKPVRVLSGPGLPSQLSWNGLDRQRHRVPDGTYTLTLQLLRATGATVTAQAQVEVDTRRPKLLLGAEPRVFKPGQSAVAVRFRSKLLDTAGLPVKWTLQVQSLEGKALRSFNGVGSPPAALEWDGMDAGGAEVAPGGLYYAELMVEMESGAQLRLPRVALASRPSDPALPFRVPLRTIHFGDGDEVIALDDFKALKDAATAVKGYNTAYHVQVLGYTARGENGRGGMGELELSFLRARAVRDFLVQSQGLDPKMVQASGLGSTDAKATAPEKERRVDVILFTQ
jgi:outer membrane protein OmpA-like peptidoglycan-associated protein